MNEGGGSNQIIYINSSKNISCKNKGIVVKMPVIITRKTINIDLNSIIKLHSKISNINSVKNRLLLEELRFLNEADTIFIKGKIKKTIYYIEKSDLEKPLIDNTLKYFTFHVPFEMYSRVQLDNLKSNGMYCNVYGEPISSKIIDNLTVFSKRSHDSIYTIMKLILEIDLLQSEYINLSSHDDEVNNNLIDTEISLIETENKIYFEEKFDRKTKRAKRRQRSKELRSINKTLKSLKVDKKTRLFIRTLAKVLF